LEQQRVIFGYRKNDGWLKGKQVQILYESITVIKEYQFVYWSLMRINRSVLGRRKRCNDLSVRKPAGCLVSGEPYPVKNNRYSKEKKR